MKKFVINKIRDLKVDLEVRVYSRPDTMKLAMARQGICYEKGTKALFQPFVIYSVSSAVSRKTRKSILFLCERNLTMRIISHESVHIVLWAFRLNKKSIKLGREADEIEENIAYAIGEVGRLLVLNLTDLGYYD